MYCWECGERLDWEDEFCPECGADPDAESGGSDWDDEHNFHNDEEDHSW
jgi:predicted amidophosphoribosyltransferase